MKIQIISLLWVNAFVVGCATIVDPMKPQIIEWGASASEIETALVGSCENGLIKRPINPPFLPNVETHQVQIDCDGFDFLGTPRWAEFIIGDNRLQMVWIMAEAEDQEKIVTALTDAYGEPSGKNDLFIAFAQNRAAWRFEPPEVLFYAAELDDWIAPWLEDTADE